MSKPLTIYYQDILDTCDLRPVRHYSLTAPRPFAHRHTDASTGKISDTYDQYSIDSGIAGTLFLPDGAEAYTSVSEIDVVSTPARHLYSLDDAINAAIAHLDGMVWVWAPAMRPIRAPRLVHAGWGSCAK
jgi:hypothetical protein